MAAVRIVADGVPAPQGSKKHVGRGRMVEASKTLPAWPAVEEAAPAEPAHGGDETTVRPPKLVQPLRAR